MLNQIQSGLAQTPYSVQKIIDGVINPFLNLAASSPSLKLQINQCRSAFNEGTNVKLSLQKTINLSV